MILPSGAQDGPPRPRTHVRPFLSGLALLFVSLFLAPTPSASQYRYDPAAYRPGENLTYKVKWGFIRLGTIVVRQEYADPDFPQFMQVWLNGESASGLPFIDVYFRSTALLDTDESTSILYELFSDREERNRTAYIYDAMNGRAFALGTLLGDVTRLDTIETPVPYYDGPGLFMFTRCSAGSDTTVLVPTIMDFAMGMTSIRFSSLTEMVDVAAFEDEVEAYPYLGSTMWEGSSFAGMSGAFHGWVAADTTRMLLKASVEIFLGSVTIELEEVGGVGEVRGER